MALKGVLDNIGGTGRKAYRAGAGLIIASSSGFDPNCKLLEFSELEYVNGLFYTIS